jgi:sulfite oxidase
LLAAGGSVEPFWAIYAQHKTKQVLELMASMQIGYVDEGDLELLKQQVSFIHWNLIYVMFSDKS